MGSGFISTNFSYPLKDPRWVLKLTIGSLLILASMAIPLIPLFFVAGFCLRIMQRVIHGDGQPHLPEWEDWEWLFKQGFRLSEAGLVYAMPGLILFIVGYIMVFFPLLGMSLSSMTSSGLQPLSPDASILLNKGVIVLGVATCLTLAGAFLSAPAAMHMVAKDDVKAIFRIREWWPALQHAPGQFIGAFVLITLAAILLMILVTALTASVILCLPATILFCAGSMVLSLIASALFASAYRKGMSHPSSN
ncbi:MAG: DUF4013 domain-containing protein [Anaerolineaceae bacterium]|nr:DUF4013 domain-containing protein [Anaerolineaceae bacterium]MBN2677769.1 DUF4013 domain-containing protein [Anaerolineaceae bacterium]